MTEPNIILVVGVSGVGKTTLCRHLAMTAPAIHHLTVSSFVEPGRPVDQIKLARRIRTVTAVLDGTCLVDGHLLVGENHISQEAVVALAPKAILVVTGSPADIAARRSVDIARSRPLVCEGDLRRLQEAEICYARKLAATFGLRFATIESQDAEGFRSLVCHKLEAGCPQGDSCSLNRYSAWPGT